VITLTTVLEARERQSVKHSTTAQIREKGRFPAVVYGKDKPNTNVDIDEIAFTKTLKKTGRNGIINLQVGPEVKEKVMLQAIQVDSLKGNVIHADFYIVDMKSKVNVDVAVHLSGEAQGVKDGGILQQPLYQVSVRSLPGDIPEAMEVNIESLLVGDTLLVSDLPHDSRFEILDDSETVIASILPPMTEAVVDSGEVQDGGELEENHGEVVEESDKNDTNKEA
jgi:large subunit ribosomal protein L25